MCTLKFQFTASIIVSITLKILFNTYTKLFTHVPKTERFVKSFRFIIICGLVNIHKIYSYFALHVVVAV